MSHYYAISILRRCLHTLDAAAMLLLLLFFRHADDTAAALLSYVCRAAFRYSAAACHTIDDIDIDDFLYYATRRHILFHCYASCCCAVVDVDIALRLAATRRHVKA